MLIRAGKRDPRDFALWKGYREGEPLTASWGVSVGSRPSGLALWSARRWPVSIWVRVSIFTVAVWICVSAP